MLLFRYPATLLRVVDGFRDGVYHKALVVGSIGGAAGGKRQDMAAAGNIHANVDKWRREQSIIRTAKWRPDLLPKADLTNKEWNEVRRLRKQWKEEVEK